MQHMIFCNKAYKYFFSWTSDSNGTFKRFVRFTLEKVVKKIKVGNVAIMTDIVKTISWLGFLVYFFNFITHLLSVRTVRFLDKAILI